MHNFFALSNNVIRDYWGRHVGLNLSAAKGANLNVCFEGKQANTYTGKTTISGYVGVSLFKENGVISISGDVDVKNGGNLVIYKNEQVTDYSRVALSGAGRSVASLSFGGKIQSDIIETIGQLMVGGNGVINFNITGSRGRRWLYMNDLIINEGSLLTIREWADGRDYLLVKKSAWHLQEALKRMEFEGYDRNAIHLASYNDEYWQISGIPELSTYGAAVHRGARRLSAPPQTLPWACRQRATRPIEGVVPP